MQKLNIGSREDENHAVVGFIALIMTLDKVQDICYKV